MLPKICYDPRSETPSSFMLAAACGGLGTAAVGALDVSPLLYPAYFGIVNAATASQRSGGSGLPARVVGLW
jgi:hypothetical protein